LVRGAWYRQKRNQNKTSLGLKIMKHHQVEPKFAVCINNEDYEVSLELRKIYKVLPDARADEHHYIRVIDESGEDYLYPEIILFLLNYQKL
jgi:hypothetical protein